MKLGNWRSSKRPYGKVKLQFSKSVGWGDANMAELLVAKEAFFLFIACSWVHSFDLIIESHSMNVVKWIKCPKLPGV